MQVICQTATHYLLPGHQQLFSPPSYLKPLNRAGSGDRFWVTSYHRKVSVPPSLYHPTDSRAASKTCPGMSLVTFGAPFYESQWAMYFFHSCMTEKVFWAQACGLLQQFHIFIFSFQIFSHRIKVSKKRQPQRHKMEKVRTTANGCETTKRRLLATQRLNMIIKRHEMTTT